MYMYYLLGYKIFGDQEQEIYSMLGRYGHILNITTRHVHVVLTGPYIFLRNKIN